MSASVNPEPAEVRTKSLLDQIAEQTEREKARAAARAMPTLGFREGMSRADIIRIVGGEAVLTDPGDWIMTRKAPVPNPYFKEYLLLVPSQLGLIKLVGVGVELHVNAYGDPLKTDFKDFLNALTDQYGQPTHSFDCVAAGRSPDSIWARPEHWMEGLYNKERILVAAWKPKPPSVPEIMLDAHAVSYETGHISIFYEFASFGRYEHADAIRKEWPSWLTSMKEINAADAVLKNPSHAIPKTQAQECSLLINKLRTCAEILEHNNPLPYTLPYQLDFNIDALRACLWEHRVVSEHEVRLYRGVFDDPNADPHVIGLLLEGDKGFLKEVRNKDPRNEDPGFLVGTPLLAIVLSQLGQVDIARNLCGAFVRLASRLAERDGVIGAFEQKTIDQIGAQLELDIKSCADAFEGKIQISQQMVQRIASILERQD